MLPADRRVGGPRGSYYVPALDGLRAVAFLMVWWTHTARPPSIGSTIPIPLPGAVQLAGAYGVPVFFVLSAFLITRLLGLEKARDGQIDLRAYYVRRTLRIWPLYFLIVGLGVAHWALIVHHVPWGAVASLATFTANWYRGFVGPIDSFAALLWSVAIEEQFYLLWPWAVARLSSRGLLNLSVAMIALAFASRVGLVVAANGEAFPRRSAYDAMWHASTSHLDALGLGALLALGADRVPRLGGWRFALAFSACLAALAAQAQWFPLSFRTTPLGPQDAIGYGIVSFVAAAMVALALGSTGTFLESRWAVGLGRLSYGMYAFHLMVIYALDSHALSRFLRNEAARAAAILGLTYALAWLSYNLYEKRFLRLKARFERIDTRPV